jgi:putative CocE/NonD family hydrolase
MKTSHRFLITILTILIFPVLSAQDITGDWYGIIQIQDISLRLNFHIQENHNGLKATFDSPDQGTYGIPVDEITLDDEIVNLSISALYITYEGRVNQDYSLLTGDLVQYGEKFPLELGREILEVPKTSPEYIKQFYEKREEYIPMRDGVRLFTSIYSPKDKSTEYPILMTRTPYNSEPRGEKGYNPRLGNLTQYTDEGYILVFQDVRGQYMSEGEFIDVRPYIPDKKSNHDIDENSDTYDAIEWLIHNVPNNNGRVGIYGVSYPGFYATMSLPEAHPALKAVSPQAPVTEWFIGDDFHHNGAFFIMDATNFYYSFGRPRPKPTRRGNPGFPWPHQDNYKFFLNMGTVDNITRKYFGDSILFWNDLMNHPNYDQFWQSRTPLPHLKNIKPAVLVVGGWFDAEDLYGPLATYQSIEEQSPSTTSNQLMMGPWSHGQWAFGNGDHLGNIYWGTNTSEYGKEKILQFFNYYLKDKGDMDLPEASIYITGLNEWHEFDTWPPENVSEVNLYFQPSNGLTFQTPEINNSWDEYISDPMKPVSYSEDVHLHRTTSYMTDDQRFASRRPDVMVYQTDDLQEEITFTGPVVADLFVTTTGTDADYVIKLIDVFPDTLNNYPPNDHNVPMQGYQMLVRGEVMRGRFRNSCENPEPVNPGEITEIKFKIPDVAHTFKKGHRIMIQVQNTWFPLVDRNPQKFVDIYHCSEEDFQKATHRIYHDSQYPSHVTLLKMNED